MVCSGGRGAAEAGSRHVGSLGLGLELGGLVVYRVASRVGGVIGSVECLCFSWWLFRWLGAQEVGRGGSFSGYWGGDREYG